MSGKKWFLTVPVICLIIIEFCECFQWLRLCSFTDCILPTQPSLWVCLSVHTGVPRSNKNCAAYTIKALRFSTFAQLVEIKVRIVMSPVHAFLTVV